ncbi:MAG: MoaD/ThiS family protein, partial [Nakamurella sp.]
KQNENDGVQTIPIRVELPGHLRTLASIPGPIAVPVSSPATIGGVLDAIEAKYPMLRGTIRDHHRGPRRPYIRFFGAEQDLSFQEYDSELPSAVATGSEPLLIVGSISGG